MSSVVFLLSVRTPTARHFSASIKCVYDNYFHLSFYFICSTILDIVLSHFVEYCQILSKSMYIVYNIYSTVYCIQYIFPLYIAYIIISLLKSIQYFFLYVLDKVHFICFTNFISNILIPLKSQVKTLKK